MTAIETVENLRDELIRIHFECNLLDDTETREETGVVIRYDNVGISRPNFSITGLNDLPPITFRLDYESRQLFILSQESHSPNNLANTSGIQSLLMLDPRVLLDVCRKRPNDMAETPSGNIIVQYNIDDFNNYI